MNPTNRRVREPQLPPGLADPPQASPPPSAPRHDPPTRPGRLASVARAVLGGALVVGLSSGVAWAAHRHITSSSRFAVTRIDVVGAKQRTEDEVARAAGLAIGVNVFSVDLDRAKASLLADPWIRDAQLARRLPGTLLVQVTEREPGALVALGDLYLASREGEIFKKLEPGDPVDLPVITGLRPEAITEDREAAVRTVRRAIDLAADDAHGPLASRASLQEVHVAGDGAFTLMVGKPSFALVLGDPPFRKKLEQAARVVAELDKRAAKPDAIMLDNEARPDRVVVRMR